MHLKIPKKRTIKLQNAHLRSFLFGLYAFESNLSGLKQGLYRNLRIVSLKGLKQISFSESKNIKKGKKYPERSQFFSLSIIIIPWRTIANGHSLVGIETYAMSNIFKKFFDVKCISES